MKKNNREPSSEALCNESEQTAVTVNAAADTAVKGKGIKKLLSGIDKQAFLRELRIIAFLVLPFLLLDGFIRFLGLGIKYSEPVAASIVFSVKWVGMIVAISRFLKGNAGRIFYAVFFALYYVLFLVHYVYYPYTGFFFSFNLLQSADEGKAYILDTIKAMNLLIVAILLITLACGIFVIAKFPKSKGFAVKKIGITLIVFVIMHLLNPFLLGAPNKSLEWDTWRNPRNVYDSFNDSNKCMKICGLFEYSFRDMYVTFLKPEEKDNPQEIKFLKNLYAKKTPHTPNEYTGIFKGKNVIFLQLEGIDSWLLNPEDMPTMYGMLDNSINFTDHYSYYNGGGSTFNSEIAVNTGFITPISYTKNAYSFNRNYFPHSLPNTFKNDGYRVNAFHMNNGEYYMRDLNYKNWGYDKYNGLVNTKKYNDRSYFLDRELIKNETFYRMMFKSKAPFMHYIITYSAHMPFNLEDSTGTLLREDAKKRGEELHADTEEDAARLFAAETDYMVKLLLEALEKNGLLENTVIVAYADHYLYTLEDKTILDKNKEFTADNRINHTPFFIWSHGMEGKTIGKTNSQIDILPTVLNMFGVKYNNEYYVGSDIMDESYPGFVFFNDYSWFDGENYVNYTDGPTGDEEYDAYVNSVNEHINELIKKNDLTLKYDYFRRMKKKK